MTARFCVNCGSPLVHGSCANCEPGAPAPGPVSPPPPSAAPPPIPPPFGQQPYGQPSFGTSAYAAPGTSRFPGSRFIGQWNWGAFFLTPLWLMNHGRVGLGVVALVLSLIPVLNIGSLIFAIWGGLRGNELAVTGRRFSDEAQFVAVQNAWRNWGFIIFALTVVCTIVVGILEGLVSLVSQMSH